MGKIVISTNVSVDGVGGTPSHSEGPLSRRGAFRRWR
jgi:hypothetical protein